jgi:hypothetical protein
VSKFRSLIASEIGGREFDRLTASEPCEAGRPSSSEKISASDAEIPRNHRRTQQLRAINRAPAFIQQLYDDDLIGVDVQLRALASCHQGTGIGNPRAEGFRPSGCVREHPLSSPWK